MKKEDDEEQGHRRLQFLTMAIANSTQEMFTGSETPLPDSILIVGGGVFGCEWKKNLSSPIRSRTGIFKWIFLACRAARFSISVPYLILKFQFLRGSICELEKG